MDSTQGPMKLIVWTNQPIYSIFYLGCMMDSDRPLNNDKLYIWKIFEVYFNPWHKDIKVLIHAFKHGKATTWAPQAYWLGSCGTTTNECLYYVTCQALLPNSILQFATNTTHTCQMGNLWNIYTVW